MEINQSPAEAINNFEENKKINGCPKILCQKCLEHTPSITLSQEKNNQISVQCFCKSCGEHNKKIINDYLLNLKSDTIFCEKSGGAHKDKEAIKKVNGKFFCEECITSILNLGFCSKGEVKKN